VSGSYNGGKRTRLFFQQGTGRRNERPAKKGTSWNAELLDQLRTKKKEKNNNNGGMRKRARIWSAARPFQEKEKRSSPDEEKDSGWQGPREGDERKENSYLDSDGFKKGKGGERVGSSQKKKEGQKKEQNPIS